MFDLESGRLPEAVRLCTSRSPSKDIGGVAALLPRQNKAYGVDHEIIDRRI